MRTTFQDQGMPLKAEDLLLAAKEVAKRRVLEPSLVETLSRWWEEKFKLPSNHDLFQECSIYELTTKFWEDHYLNDPLSVYRNEKGEVQFVKTGDPLIDKWEQELADGKTPNYLEAFTQDEIKRLNDLRTRAVDRFNKPAQRSNHTIGEATAIAAEESLESRLLRRFKPAPGE